MNSKKTTLTLRLITVVTLLTATAFAAPAGNTLPWEGAITNIYNSVTGPVALGVAGISFVSAGAVLVFGGDVPEFGRRIAYLALVGALLVAGPAVITGLLGVGASVI